MRLVCFAYSLIGHMGLEFFLGRDDCEVVALFTHEDRPTEQIWWPSVAGLVREHDVPVYTPEDVNGPRGVKAVAAMRPDFIFSFWYRTLLSRRLLGTASCGALNMHGSLLPLYRGRAPVNWALVNGERQTGMTLHHMTAQADAGEIAGQVAVPVGEDTTALELYHDLARAGRELLEAVWPLLRDGSAPRVPQDHSRATTVPGRRPEDGRFEWWWPAIRIHDMVRAVTHPWPGAFTVWRGRRLLVWRTRRVSGPAGPLAPEPGTVLDSGPGGLRVATCDGCIALQRLQRDGDVEMAAIDFAERYGLRPGDRLDEPAGGQQ